MRIGLNPVGNYSPSNISNTVKQAKASHVEKNAASKKVDLAKQDNLLPEEKDFFTKLYPQNKSEIADYHFYEKSGKLSGVKLGSLIDRRG